MMVLSLDRQFHGAAAELLPWMHDDEVTDILVNGTQSLFLEKKGELIRVESPFATREALMHFIERLLVPLGRRVDASKPYLDGQLADGSRFHLILPPLATPGPVLSIRKAGRKERIPLEAFGDVAWLLEKFHSGKNVLICGGTGSGKTTLLARLLDTVPENDRLVVVEETPEIRLDHPHAVFLQARPPTPDGMGEVTLRTLLRNALRMRPTRLVLGECRGEEAWDLIQALNTGHEGSACTLHANSPMDALRRLETLLLLGGNLPLAAAREWVASAVGVVVHLERRNGKRQIAGMMEIQGMEGDRYRIHPRLC